MASSGGEQRCWPPQQEVLLCSATSLGTTSRARFPLSESKEVTGHGKMKRVRRGDHCAHRLPLAPRSLLIRGSMQASHGWFTCRMYSSLAGSQLGGCGPCWYAGGGCGTPQLSHSSTWRPDSLAMVRGVAKEVKGMQLHQATHSLGDNSLALHQGCYPLPLSGAHASPSHTSSLG